MNRSFADFSIFRKPGISPRNFKKVTLSRMSKFSASRKNRDQKMEQCINDDHDEKCTFKPTRFPGSD